MGDHKIPQQYEKKKKKENQNIVYPNFSQIWNNWISCFTIFSC